MQLIIPLFSLNKMVSSKYNESFNRHSRLHRNPIKPPRTPRGEKLRWPFSIYGEMNFQLRWKHLNWEVFSHTLKSHFIQTGYIQHKKGGHELHMYNSNLNNGFSVPISIIIRSTWIKNQYIPAMEPAPVTYQKYQTNWTWKQVDMVTNVREF